MMKKAVLFLIVAAMGMTAHAQTNSNHLMMGVGMLYERGLDFATGYLQYDDDPDAGHVTKKSFWHNYNSWHLGIAYKPCVNRGRNHHGNLRIGASGGSDLHDFVGGVHVGYEHSYALRYGWQLFFQVKEDVVIRGEDLFRTGLAVGVKVPL